MMSFYRLCPGGIDGWWQLVIVVVPTKRNQREQPTEACLGLAAYVIINLGLGLDIGCEAVILGFTIQIFHQMASYTIRQSYKILVCEFPLTAWSAAGHSFILREQTVLRNPGVCAQRRGLDGSSARAASASRAFKSLTIVGSIVGLSTSRWQ